MSTISYSPVIKNGDYSIDESGELVVAADIITQMTVTLTAYDCIYNPSVNSRLIPYIRGTLPGSAYQPNNQNAITSIVVSAYQALIQDKTIASLSVAITAQVLNEVNLKVTAQELNGADVSLSWSSVGN